MKTTAEDMAKYTGQNVNIFLTNGIKLAGKCKEVSGSGLYLERQGQVQYVMYTAIATCQAVE